jgi:hypothetical protein
MKKFEEVKRPAIGIEQSSIKPSLGKVIEFYTDKVKEYHNAFNEMNKYIDGLEAQLDYYKKDKRFEVMAEEILSLKSQLEKQQPEIPEVPQFVANWYEKVSPIFLEGCIFDFILSNPQRGASASSEFEKWFMENNNSIEILIDMKRLGYTVKEKRFYLKDNRELESVGNTCIGYVTLYLKNDGYLTTDKTRAGKFTQSEIDSMETESYEQIEVGE